METNKNNEKDNFLKTNKNNENKLKNDNSDIKIYKKDNITIKKIEINNKKNAINLIPRNKRKISKNQTDNNVNSSSFLTFRKIDESKLKKNENSLTLNENNINLFSISNISNTNLLNNKNENIFRKINLTSNLKNKNKDNTMNKVDKIYDNKIELKLRLNNDEIIRQNQMSNKFINHNFKNNILFQKLNKNNFVKINSRSFNEINNSDINKKESSKIFKIYCFICNSYKEKLYHAKKCKHYFCKECGKNYYETQVEKSNYSLKCPKYTCTNNLSLNNLKELLSKEDYNKIETFQKTNNKINKLTLIKYNEKYIPNLHNQIINKRNSIETVSNESYKGLKNMKMNFFQIPHSKKNTNNFVLKNIHILKFLNSTKFKNKIQIEREKNKILCSKCKNYSLFTREGLKFIRCLNCDYAFCKYCHKQIGKKIRIRALICGICYGKRKKKLKKPFGTKLIYEFLLVFSGFFIAIIGFSIIETKFFIKRKKKYYFFYILVFIVIFIVNCIIGVILFPYFPIFIYILDN